MKMANLHHELCVNMKTSQWREFSVFKYYVLRIAALLTFCTVQFSGSNLVNTQRAANLARQFLSLHALANSLSSLFTPHLPTCLCSYSLFVSRTLGPVDASMKRATIELQYKLSPYQIQLKLTQNVSSPNKPTNADSIIAH